MIRLRAVRGFHIGGDLVHVAGLPLIERQPFQGATDTTVDPNGFYPLGQMYAQHFALEQPRHALPILFWHGGGMTGATWETTPDKRAGWHDHFMRAGYDTYLCDAVERGRAGPPAQILVASEPVHRTIDQAWSNFRFGPPGGFRADGRHVTYPGLAFPAEAAPALARQMVGRWNDGQLDALALAAYEALVASVGPCIVIAHSQGAGFALEVATRLPHLVRAVVAIEPSFVPEGGACGTGEGQVRRLIVWGDYLDQVPYWRSTRAAVDAYLSRVRGNGTAVDELELTRIGIHGNSHMLMMDRNSSDIAARVEQWLARM